MKKKKNWGDGGEEEGRREGGEVVYQNDRK